MEHLRRRYDVTGPRPNRAEWEKLTAPERMEKRLEHVKRIEARMTKKLEAMKGFYAQLTPEQRTTLDKHMKKGRKHKHG